MDILTLKHSALKLYFDQMYLLYSTGEQLTMTSYL